MKKVTRATQTSQADRKRIDEFFSNIQETMEYLSARWQDEKEYEDIGDYRKRLCMLLPVGFRITKMSKRPFGFHFAIIGFPAEYRITMTNRSYAWERTA